MPWHAHWLAPTRQRRRSGVATAQRHQGRAAPATLATLHALCSRQGAVVARRLCVGKPRTRGLMAQVGPAAAERLRSLVAEATRTRCALQPLSVDHKREMRVRGAGNWGWPPLTTRTARQAMLTADPRLVNEASRILTAATESGGATGRFAALRLIQWLAKRSPPFRASLDAHVRVRVAATPAAVLLVAC